MRLLDRYLLRELLVPPVNLGQVEPCPPVHIARTVVSGTPYPLPKAARTIPCRQFQITQEGNLA